MKTSFLFALIAGLLLLQAVRTKTSADNWATINEEKIVIGLDDTFVPMGFRDKDGKLTGFDIDLAKAVFEQYGITVDFQPIDWSMKEFELNNGTIDLIWNGYSKTPAREKKVQFTKPYMENDQVLITPKESGITNFGQMNNKRLGAQMGHLVMMYLRNNQKY